MKKMFRKNQIIITALALMIAVAGYISYMNENIDDKAVAQTAANASDAVTDDAMQEEYEISDEDSLLEGDIFVAEEPDESVDVAQETTETNVDAQVEEGENMENAGAAVLTSTTVGNVDFAAEMKLNREQIRSKNKEALLEIIDNTSVTEEQKQSAVNEMITMTDIAEREAAAEMLLEAKGFSDVVVSITDESCDVVLNMGDVTDAKRAQVEDIVKRKTNISAENIVITPITTQAQQQ
ncbi:MAG: SpoIIIAH-like family protein [Roseburia sp.]|uniref:SpoIIIAH-like family protein n=1 Tax=Roseburia sp. 831b TaxID=1261635 RepID=UPI000950F59C|nr:SpoIIIAH-like family protein [Roseburia sp. 831b]MCI5919697.1 SpoIIIAH-like family protein [Roseburia sp.]MDD6217428.1 SpoIIIAH-like family protein [Roseburia sp.]MDY5884363.1 SpoIIIAH-like family protein [Roseburia sp.]WVK71657.1 SpoIIIAH-like family protein [Roseburia sp. 831b]